jgi:hypothetical protein
VDGVWDQFQEKNHEKISLSNRMINLIVLFI